MIFLSNFQLKTNDSKHDVPPRRQTNDKYASLA